MIALAKAMVQIAKELAKIREAIERCADALEGDQRDVRWKVGTPRPE